MKKAKKGLLLTENDVVVTENDVVEKCIPIAKRVGLSDDDLARALRFSVIDLYKIKMRHRIATPDEAKAVFSELRRQSWSLPLRR